MEEKCSIKKAAAHIKKMDGKYGKDWGLPSGEAPHMKESAVRRVEGKAPSTNPAKA